MFPKRPSRFTWWMIFTAILAVVSVGVGDRFLTHWAYAVELGKIQANSDELAGVQEVSKAFRMVAKVAKPGVVHIRVRGRQPSEEQVQKYEDRLDRQFGEPRTERQRRLRRRQLRNYRETPRSSGSGIVFDENGHIVTNNHVVGDRSQITVVLPDNREFEATVVGSDPKTDIALIKIDAGDLHPLKFGDSDLMEVGDWVLAVGAPFGLTQSVTHGIISATGRTSDDVPIRYQNFLQTDAAINPGNSGGPLLNLKGEVVGVNTAIATNGVAYNAGIAFTIPSNMVVKIANELKSHGEVVRGWLGIRMAEIDEDDREIFGIKGSHGVLIDSVLSDTPAQKAGLTVEDVILEVDGTPVRDMAHIRALIADVMPDKVARLKVVRDRRLRQIKVRMARQPANLGGNDAEAVNFRELDDLGVAVRSLRPADARRYGYDSSDRGVLIIGIKSGSQLKRRELVVACNGTPIASVYDLSQAVKAIPAGDDITLRVMDPAGDRRVVVLDSAK